MYVQVIDTVFPNAGESLLAAYDRWRSWADNKVVCNFGLSVVVSAWSDRAKEEMSQLAKDKGINSFVFHMANKAQGYMVRDDALFQAFNHCKQIGALARVHAENGDVVHEVNSDCRRFNSIRHRLLSAASTANVVSRHYRSGRSFASQTRRCRFQSFQSFSLQ